MRQDTNDTGKTRTCWRADDCYTDEATRRTDPYRDKERENIREIVGSKEKRQENRTQGIHCHKASRLCYKAELGTLSHYLTSSCFRRRRYLVSPLPLSSPTSAKKSTKTKQNYQDTGDVATQVPLISRTGTLPHDLLSFHFCFRRQQ